MDENNPYAPSQIMDLFEAVKLPKKPRRTLVSYLIALGIVVSFLFVESSFVRLMVKHQWVEAIAVGCIAIMHIPLVYHDASWRARFASSLTIPLALAGAIVGGGSYLWIGRSWFRANWLSNGIGSLGFLIVIVFCAIVAGRLGYRFWSKWMAKIKVAPIFVWMQRPKS